MNNGSADLVCGALPNRFARILGGAIVTGDVMKLEEFAYRGSPRGSGLTSIFVGDYGPARKDFSRSSYRDLGLYADAFPAQSAARVSPRWDVWPKE